MSDFVYDGTTVPDGKSDLVPLTGTPSKHVTAAEWNTVMAAIQDLRDAVTAGNYHGLVSDPTAAVSAAGGVRLRSNAGALEVSQNGAAFAALTASGALPLGYVDVTNIGISTSNTGTQNSDAFDAAIAALPLVSGKPVGQVWLFGSGTYNFARTLDITRQMQIIGVSGMNFGATLFMFPTAVTGIIIHSDASAGAGNRGDWAVIKDIVLTQASKTTDADGIFVKGHGRLERVYCYSWARNGIRINASVGSSPTTNANNWRMFDCRVDYNGSHGIFIQGGDTNAGTAIMCESNDNGGYGVYEDSFLGNTWIGLHTATNVSGGVWSQGVSSRNIFVGCYSEGDEPASLIDSPATVLGGIVPSGVVGNSLRLTSGAASNPVLFTNSGGTKTGSVQVGTRDGTQGYMEYWNSDDASPIRFKYGQNYGIHNTGFYSYNYANLNGASGLNIAGNTAQITTADGALALAAGRVYFDYRFWLGPSKIEAGLSAAPTSGNWKVGDVSLSLSSTVGTHAGWVCSASGTAGTYTEGRTATTNGTTAVTISSASTALFVGDKITINATTVFITALSGTAMTVSGAIAAAGPGLAITYSAPTFKKYGLIVDSVDDSGSSGTTVTQNNMTSGRVAISAGNKTMTVTNNLVAATSVIHATLQTVDGTLTQILSVVPGAGSFVINCDANATGNTKICWTLVP